MEPTTVAPFFVNLKSECPDIVFKDCLMTMNWLTLYETYSILSGRWKYCEEYIGSKVMEYGMLMARVVIKKIAFELNDDVEQGRTIECCTFMVNKFRLDSSTRWFDYKTHSCGVNYEFFLATCKPRVVRVHGPFASSIHNNTVFRGGEANDKANWDKNALYFQLKGTNKCIADSGYNGKPSKIVTSKDEHSSKFREYTARAKNY